MYLCPSDPTTNQIDQNNRREGNYMVNWGNSNWNQNMFTHGSTRSWAIPWFRATPCPSSAPRSPWTSRIGVQNITDGTSNTLLMAEVIIGATDGAKGYEHRGDLYNDDYNCAMFMAYTTPNSTIPDWIADGYCRYPYLTNPPCTAAPPAAPMNACTMRPGATTLAESMRS